VSEASETSEESSSWCPQIWNQHCIWWR